MRMKTKRSMEELHYFITPRVHGMNSNIGANHIMRIEGDKLVLDNGYVILDESLCKTSEDRDNMINGAFNRIEGRVR
jgi:hypothetical protein